jgi:predicted Zn-dependent protease
VRARTLSELLRPLLAVAIGSLLLYLAAQPVFRPDPHDDLRRADGLFAAGRYHDALAAYRALHVRAPELAAAYAHRGMVHAIRAEQIEAERALARALGLGLGGAERDLVRIYQAQLATNAGRPEEAARLHGLIDPRSPYVGVWQILDAERQLRGGDYPAAEAALRAALREALPAEWRTLAHQRLALMRASSDPAAALAELRRIPQATRAERPLPYETFARPLLPSLAPAPESLAAALAADVAQRAQLLGQIYLESGLYPLAAAQFAAAGAQTGADPLAAAAYDALVRWRAADRAGTQTALTTLADANPTDARLRVLAALAALAAGDLPTAREQLAAARRITPDSAPVHAALGALYIAERDYIAAAEELASARDRAPPQERGAYALGLARFYVDTTVQVCVEGRPAAVVAAELLPEEAAAWSTLAAAEIACGDATAAAAAARRALAIAPQSAEALYALGRALAAQGDTDGARAALVAAADAAPASEWRARAEAQLSLLGG